MMAQSKTGVMEHTVLLNMVYITITVYACAFKFLFFNFTSWGIFFSLQMVAVAILLVWNKTV